MDFVHPVAAVIPGARGRILAVLVETTAGLSVRTIARLAGVSPAQASRVLPELATLGIVERTEVPPSSIFRLVRSNVAAQAIVQLADARRAVLTQLGAALDQFPDAPLSVVVFGSFARREADADSDLDVLFVRPDEIEADDPTWFEALERWRGHARAVAGLPVEIIEIARADVASRLGGRSDLWRDIERDAVVIYGRTLEKVIEYAHA